MPADEPSLRSRVFAATALSGIAHVVLDWVATRVAWTTPPHLLLDHAGEVFRDLLAMDRTMILGTMSVLSAGVNGAIAGLLAAAMDGVRRRVLVLGAVLSGLWIVSGGLLMVIYLSPPWPVRVGSLAAGIPRAFLIAWLIERLVLSRDAPVRPEAGST